MKMRVMIHKAPEAERVVVKSIDQFPHGFDALTHLCSVIAKLRCGSVAGREGSVDGVGGELAAAQRQEDPGRKDGVEKRKGVPDQDQSVGRAIAGTVGIL